MFNPDAQEVRKEAHEGDKPYPGGLDMSSQQYGWSTNALSFLDRLEQQADSAFGLQQQQEPQPQQQQQQQQQNGDVEHALLKWSSATTDKNAHEAPAPSLASPSAMPDELSVPQPLAPVQLHSQKEHTFTTASESSNSAVDSSQQQQEHLVATIRKLKEEKAQLQQQYDELLEEGKAASRKQQQLQERVRSLKAQLDKSQQQANVQQGTSTPTATSSTTESELARLREELEQSRGREEALVEEKEQLSASLQSLQDESSRREHQLHQDKLSLEQRCQRSEARAEELASSVPRATEPLMRQIEELQSQNAEQAQMWSDGEKKLREQLHAAEQRAVAAEETAEREKQASQRANAAVEQLRTQLYEKTAEVDEIERVLGEKKTRVEQQQWELERAQQTALERERETSHSQKEASSLREALINEQKKTSELREEVSSLTERLREAQTEQGLLQQEDASAAQVHVQQHQINNSNKAVEDQTDEDEETMLRKKQRKLEAAESRVRELEAVRDELEQRLVSQQQTAAKQNHGGAHPATTAASSASQGEHDSLERRYVVAVELLGERDEEVEQLQEDVAELKRVVQEQANTIAELSAEVSPDGR